MKKHNFNLILTTLSLTLYLVYVALNIFSRGEGTLVSFFLCFAIVSSFLLFSNGKIVLISYPKSLLSSMAFIGYFVFLCFLTVKTDLAFQYVMGSTSGVFLAFISGVLFCNSFFLWLESNGSQIKVANRLSFILLVIFIFIFCLVLSLLSDVRTSQIHLVGSVERYQRAGDLIIMLFFIACVFVLSKLFYSSRVKDLIFSSIYIVFIAVLLMLLSQMYGSNAAFVSVFALMLIMITLIFFLLDAYDIKFKLNLSFFISRYVIKYFTYAFVSVGFLLFVLSVFDFDFSKFRIFGYGSGEITSVVTRAELLKLTFLKQFSIDPIFGNMNSHIISGFDEGQYPHSLLSLLTHTGLIGFSLFFFMMVINCYQLYKLSISGFVKRFNVLFFFILLSLLGLLVIALFTKFFNWFPLWFVVGFSSSLSLRATMKYKKEFV